MNKIIKKSEATKELQVFTDTTAMGAVDEVTSSDVQMPSIMLMQSNSKIVSDRANKIQSGDFVHSITGDTYGSTEDNLKVCVVDMFKTQVITETEGNNWVSTLPWLPEMESQKYLEVVDGKEIKRQKCFNYICFRPLDIREIELPTGEKHYVASPFVVKFKGGSVKNAKKFNQLLQDLALFKQPSWAMYFWLNAYEETNDKGTFFVYEMKKAEPSLKETQFAAAALCQISQSARKAGLLNVDDSEETNTIVDVSPKPLVNHAPQQGSVEVY